VEVSAQILSYSWEAESINFDTNGQAEGVHILIIFRKMLRNLMSCEEILQIQILVITFAQC
jgi:hypothetical protein